MKEQAKIKQAVERKLVSLLNGKRKPPPSPKKPLTEVEQAAAQQAIEAEKEAAKQDLQILNMSIKYLAVSAKIDESEWGSGLEGLDDEEVGLEKQETN